MTIKSRADLNTDADTTLPNNTAGDVSPADVRTNVKDLADSALNVLSNLSDLDNAGTARTNLGLAIGSDVQAFSSVLAATTASFTTADETKLDGVEASATANPNAVDSDTTGITGADAISNMVSLTQAEYDALTPNASTFYVIVG